MPLHQRSPYAWPEELLKEILGGGSRATIFDRRLGRVSELFVAKLFELAGFEVESPSPVVVKDLVDGSADIRLMPDMVVRSTDGDLIYVEVKSMPRGIQKKPDSLKAVFDYIHFKAFNMNKKYIIISIFDKYRAKGVRNILSTWSDGYLTILRAEARSAETVELIYNEVHEIIEKVSERPKFTRLNELTKNVVQRNWIVYETENVPLNIISELKPDLVRLFQSKGIEFEKQLRKVLQRHLATKLLHHHRASMKVLGIGPEISLEADLFIPQLNIVIECKARKSGLDTAEARAAIIEALTWKKSLGANSAYILVTNPGVHIQGYVRKYLDLAVSAPLPNEWARKIANMIYTLKRMLKR